MRSQFLESWPKSHKRQGSNLIPSQLLCKVHRAPQPTLSLAPPPTTMIWKLVGGFSGYAAVLQSLLRVKCHLAKQGLLPFNPLSGSVQAASVCVTPCCSVASATHTESLASLFTVALGYGITLQLQFQFQAALGTSQPLPRALPFSQVVQLFSRRIRVPLPHSDLARPPCYIKANLYIVAILLLLLLA